MVHRITITSGHQGYRYINTFFPIEGLNPGQQFSALECSSPERKWNDLIYSCVKYMQFCSRYKLSNSLDWEECCG